MADCKPASEATYYAHRRNGTPTCEACKQAHSAAEKRRELARMAGQPPQVHALGTQRRLLALAALGWTYTAVAREAGFYPRYVAQLATARTHVHRDTAERVTAVYNRLSMRLPPTGTPDQRRSAARARTLAKRHGGATPLAWEGIDMDDPKARPNRGPAKSPRVHLDEIAIERRLAGDRTVRLRPGESAEVVRRALASGMTTHQIRHQLGIKTERHTRIDNSTPDTEEEGTAA